MYKYLLLFLCALAALNISAQSETRSNFNGYGLIGNVAVGGSNGGQYTLTMTFNDDSGAYTKADVQVGDYIWDVKCDRYSVVHVVSTSPFLVVEVIRQNNNGVAPGSGGGNVLVYRPTTNYGYVPSLSKLNSGLRDCITNHLIIELDEDINIADNSSGSSGIDSTTYVQYQDSCFIGFNWSAGTSILSDTICFTLGVTETVTDSFNFNRTILRLPEVGDNLGVSTISEYFEWQYFTAPTVNLTSTGSTIYEVGDSARFNLVTNVTNPGSAVLSSGVLINTANNPNDTITIMGGTAGDVTTIDFVPTQNSSNLYEQLSYTFKSSYNWTGSGESGTINSNNRTINAVYPVLYGVSSTDWGSNSDHGTAPYINLSKLVQSEGNKSVPLNGTGFIYYAVPTTWNDTNLSSIIDGNGFNVTPSFTSYTVTISSSSQYNDWSQTYILYKLNNNTTVNATYTFNR